jgi:hypothetical protein
LSSRQAQPDAGPLGPPWALSPARFGLVLPRPKIADRKVLLDIKQAARSLCKEAIERLAGHMRSKDERVSMLACIAMLERGAMASQSSGATARSRTILRLFQRSWARPSGWSVGASRSRWRCRRLITMRPPESSRPRHPARKGAGAAFLRGHLLDERAQLHGAGFRSLRDSWADTTTPYGQLMLTILGGLAEFERSLIVASTGAESAPRAPVCGSAGRPP